MQKHQRGCNISPQQPGEFKKKNWNQDKTEKKLTPKNTWKTLQTKAPSTKESFSSLNVLPTFLQPHSTCVRHHISLEVQNCSRRRIQGGRGRGKEKQLPVFSLSCKYTNSHVNIQTLMVFLNNSCLYIWANSILLKAMWIVEDAAFAVLLELWNWWEGFFS